MRVELLQIDIKSPVLRFTIRFVLFFLAAQALVWVMNASEKMISVTLKLITITAGILYQLWDSHIWINGNMMLHPDNGRYLVIDQSCTGFQMTATLVAGLAASGCRKWTFYGLTILFIQVLNQIRIVHLFGLIHGDWTRFEFYHLGVWQGANFILACLFFYFLLWYGGRHGSGS